MSNVQGPLLCANYVCQTAAQRFSDLIDRRQERRLQGACFWSLTSWKWRQNIEHTHTHVDIYIYIYTQEQHRWIKAWIDRLEQHVSTAPEAKNKHFVVFSVSVWLKLMVCRDCNLFPGSPRVAPVGHIPVSGAYFVEANFILRKNLGC